MTRSFSEKLLSITSVLSRKICQFLLCSKKALEQVLSMTECNSSQHAGCKSATLQKLHSTTDDLLAIFRKNSEQLF